MKHSKIKRTIRKLIPFGLIWLLSGWVFLVVELAAMEGFHEPSNSAIQVDVKIFILSSIAIAGVGLLSGYIELKYLSQLFANKNLSTRIFYKIIIYCLFFFMIVFITFPLAASLELKTHVFDKRVWDKYFIYSTSITHFSTALQLFTALILSLFYTEVSEFIGQGVLTNFFTGKYHTPVEEERIFMFLDMKSSTTIAEKLGHHEYFKLLREYYRSFTDAIIEHEGEIYQYVGDEIILSWKLQGDYRDARCLDCFFDMKKSLKKRAHCFEEKFGEVPTFKAGIHFGKVTIGEIGTIKKDMMFSGDVLNAAARMQSMCNTHEVDLIISGELINRINTKNKYEIKFLGQTKLRGKVEKKDLYTVAPIGKMIKEFANRQLFAHTGKKQLKKSEKHQLELITV